MGETPVTRMVLFLMECAKWVDTSEAVVWKPKAGFDMMGEVVRGGLDVLWRCWMFADAVDEIWQLLPRGVVYIY